MVREDYCELDGSRIVSGLKCLALVDIQEETEFPETLCVCVCVCVCVCGSVRLRLWHVRRDFVARDFLEDVFFVSLSVTSRDVYDSCGEGNIGRDGTIRCVHVLH